MSPADSSECQKDACVTDDWGASGAPKSSRQFNQFNSIQSPTETPKILKTGMPFVVRTAEKAAKQLVQ